MLQRSFKGSRRRSPAPLFLALFIARAVQLGAQDYEALFVPDPAIAALGAKGESLSLGELETAAFLASGLAPERLPHYRLELDSALGALALETKDLADPGARAEAVLEFLHRHVLKSYRAEATTLDQILDRGSYNCVSSAVLYLIAARSLGLDAEGVQTTDHAFCLVRLPGRDVDVETTNPAGYDPGTKRAFTDSFGRVTGFAYVPPGDYGRRSTIGGKALVGLIISNRVVLAESAGDFASSLRLGVDYDALERSASSRSFLIDRINNRAADLVQDADYAGAGELAAAARRALGDESRLVELARKTAYLGAAALAQAGKWEEALDEAARVRARGLEAPELASLIAAALNNEVVGLLKRHDFAGARRVLAARAPLAEAGLVSSLTETVGEAELSEAARNLPFTDALAAANTSLASGAVSREAWTRGVDLVYLNEANRIAHTGDWLGAAAVAAQGAAAAPGDGSLARAAQSYRANFVAVSHNAFASLYNSRRFGEARDAVSAALAHLPDDPTLLRDLDLADRALGR